MMNDKFVFNNETELSDLGGGVKRKVLAYSEDMMQVEVHFEQGSIGSEHRHPHTPTTYVLCGEFEFTVDGETGTVKQGDMVYMPANSLHGCRCIKDGILLDSFTPYREDFVK